MSQSVSLASIATTSSLPVDGARPSVLTLSVSKIALRSTYDTAKPLNLRAKLRNAVKWVPGFGVEHGVDLLVTFQTHLFDVVKIDLFEPSKRRSGYIGRAKLQLSEFDDWRFGSYTKDVKLLSQDGKTSVGVIWLDLLFTPVLHEGEGAETLEELHAFLEKLALDNEQTAPAPPALSAASSFDQIDAQRSQDVNSEDDFEAEGRLDFADELSDRPPLPPQSFGSQSESQIHDSDPMDSETVKVASNPATRAHFLRASTIREVRDNPSAATILNSRKLSLDSSEVLETIMKSIDTQGPEFPALSDVGRSKSLGTSTFNIKMMLRLPSMRGGKRSIDSSGTSIASDDSRHMRESPEPTESTASVIMPSGGLKLGKPKLLAENTSYNLGEVKELMTTVFKNDFNMPFHRMVKVVQFLYKFENGLPIPRTGNIVKDMELFEVACRLLDHSLAVYGVVMYGFSTNTLSLKDTLRFNADEKTAIEHLKLTREAILHWDHTKREASTSRYYILHDPALDAIVISVQGTVSAAQILTDLNGEYFPFQEGAAHQGILRAAQQILERHGEELLRWAKERAVDRIFCTGHSLGAGVGALLTMLLQERLEEFRKVTEKPHFAIRGHCFATPGVVTKPLVAKYEAYIDNYVMENDTIPRLSFGTLLAFKDMVVEAGLVMDKKLPDEEAFELLQQRRVEILEKYDGKMGMIPGRVFHLYKTVRKIPRRHHTRLNIQEPLFKTAYRTMPLPDSEKPEVPHYVMELARPEFFAYIAPRRHIFNHHLPWSYDKSVNGAMEWLRTEGQADDAQE
ncbi:hypothetical protein BC830DRAFT_1153507 [Chytriomyces sp. MP71]|nr:hypothetical protein BC830DRAFT_1153507 [Chytriomyces sp. MP71]